jgi:hypothetical protein
LQRSEIRIAARFHKQGFRDDGERSIDEVIEIMFQRANPRKPSSETETAMNDFAGGREAFAGTVRQMIMDLRDQGFLM